MKFRYILLNITVIVGDIDNHGYVHQKVGKILEKGLKMLQRAKIGIGGFQRREVMHNHRG